MTARTARRRAATLRSLFGALVCGVVVVVGSGCSAITLMPSLDDELDRSLAHMVESAQDSLWDFRDGLATDPEATLPQTGFVSDARPAYQDPAFTVGGGSLTLLGLSTSPEGTTLILATSGGASSGGGWFYQSRSAAVCFTLRFPVDEAAIHTEPSDCSDGQGHGLKDLAEFERHGDPVPLDDLDVRRTVTEADFPALPCQCSSGGDCDCPGG